jgi:tRNA modification GTPase
MAVESIERKAAVAREGVSASAELVLWCSAAAGTGALESRPAFPADQPVLFVATKCDLANSAARAAAVEDAVIATSARTGQGLLELREAIARWTASSGAGEPTVVAGTAARCRHAVEQARVATERALDALDGAASDELIALELRLALDELGQVVGAVCTNDLLDRIFSRFCIGK